MGTKKRKLSLEHLDSIANLVILGTILLTIIFLIGYRNYVSDKNLIPISVIAIIAGIIFENKRLSTNWSTVLWISLGSFCGSMLSFLPGKNEVEYNLDNHIAIWPYAFIFIFLIIAISILEKKIIPALTEGITLLQSVAVIYWVIDHGLIYSTNDFLKAIMLIGFGIASFSIFHAFTHSTLSKASRFILSLWSTVIITLLAFDNIYRIFQNQQIENSPNLVNGLYIGFQHFLLGVSSIYIVQNILMITGFFPGKGTFFNSQYFSEVKELKQNHINRYSENQVDVFHSFLCVLFSGIIFSLNYYFQLIPRNIMIWMVFVIFPFIPPLYEKVLKRKY